MKRLIFYFVFCLPFVTFAQDVRVSNSRPTAVFTPAPGGYILRQPGPNLSSTPSDLNPSGGLPGKPGFSGGKQYRAAFPDFEMGGKYDMPIPKTGQTVPVDVVSKVPKKAMAKALLKTLPLVGNAIALKEFMDDVAEEWDLMHPSAGTPTIVEPLSGDIYRSGTSTSCTCPEPANGACGVAPVGGAAPDGMCLRGAFTYPDGRSFVNLGTPKIVVIKESVPDSVVDSASEKMASTDVDTILENLQSNPKWPAQSLSLPPDLPTVVTGPESVPSKTTTTSASDGTQTTTTNETKINYIDNTVKITTTSTTNITNPAGQTQTTTSTTTDNSTPDDPNPKTPEAQKEGILCSLFPDILACKKLEEPTKEELPKRDQDITLQTGPSFSGGSCPPDVVVSVGGHQVTVLATAEPCGWIEGYMKPIILLLASISAVFIVMPRAGD